MIKPKVSILCTAYNHENFIRSALDGFVMQKTNFPFEVIVHDDASTDKTADIIREYEKKYPDIIKPIYQTENQFSQGKDILIDCMIDYIHGEYVAMNEGDDYWTDKNKLQKQVDFLDSHPDFSICFHPVRVIWEDNSKKETIFPNSKQRFSKEVLSLDDLLKHNFIQTNSVMYRWRLTKEIWPQKRILPCDYLWHLIHAEYGKIGFIPDIMSVYRRNAGGIWTGYGETDNWFLRYGIPHMRFYQEMEKRYHQNRELDLNFIGHKIVSLLLKKKSWKDLENFADEFPEIWENISFGSYEKKLHKKIRYIKKKYMILKYFFLFLIVAIIFFYI